MFRYVIQVATPYSTGTGIYLPQYDLIVTNEHVVRDTASVVVGAPGMEEQLVRVVYLDAHYDLAFLHLERAHRPDPLPLGGAVTLGDPVTAIGLHFGGDLQSETGTVTDTDHNRNGIRYLLHDARGEFTYGGGPLMDAGGRLVGVNMMDLPELPPRTLCLPVTTLEEILDAFRAGGGVPAARCFDCRTITFEAGHRLQDRCPNCGAGLTLPSLVHDPQPTGVNATIEQIITAGGHDPRLARRGPNLWNIRRGSATIQLAYHEDSGLVTGDAYLCKVPTDAGPELFAYLLRENARLRQLTFSTYGRDIILSLLIYDRYLSVDTALPRFERLFEQADAYDNVLVEEFGAGW
ncbi:trypsin-like peptidase domain-containing protein [Lewinella sp. JB7]|uniref:trypsin-like peptidase domain-containing protein n=1 Tax=Lewinella sp. JB7 TaxID=2962887 RepID=UPI0020C9AE2F|nr:trypsin-like peptidase domain-containing protein [Lewinella sp. JB7]MCP9235637.1 trypsin-like peptidase domain-containing protein [Lewinella sp. JB7]